MSQLTPLSDGTLLANDYKIVRVLGAGGFGVTYLADEPALSRRVSIKEYFPADFATREDSGAAVPRSRDCAGDYQWGLDRFIEEAQTLAQFDHRNIVKVYRTFRANNTAYMVLQFEDGQSLKTWLKGLSRAPRQAELDAIIAPLLDALAEIHRASFLHRDIAPDNIILRTTGEPVLIDFGAARGDIAAHSKTKTVSALVKPGYSPYEQYAETSSQQGPWTDIYALAATLYHAVTGKRPPDSPSRMLKDEMVATRDAAVGAYRATFLDAIQKGLALAIEDRPRSVAEWRGALLAPEPERPGVLARLRDKTEARRAVGKAGRALAAEPGPGVVPPPPDAPGPKGRLLDFVDALQQPAARLPEPDKVSAGKGPPPPAARTNAVPVAGKRGGAVAPANVAAKPARRKRARPAPDVARPKLLTRALKAKLAMAAVLTAGLIAGQDHIPRLLAVPPHTLATGSVKSTPAVERTLQLAGTFKAHDSAVTALALSGDGRLIVTTAGTGVMKIWDSATHTARSEVMLEDGPAVSLTVRNNRALTSHGNGAINIYDLDTARRLYRFKRNDATVWSAAFAGSEDRVAAAGHDWSVALWQTASETEPAALLAGHQSAVQAVAAAPSGRWLASGGADRTVKLWNLDSNTLRRSYRKHADFVSALAFAPDGETLASGGLDGAVHVWSTASGLLLRSLSGHSARITSLAFTPDRAFIASAAEDGTVRVRGLKQTRLYWSLNGLGSGATTLAFTNDGGTLLTGGQDGLVRMWSLPPAQVAQRE